MKLLTLQIYSLVSLLTLTINQTHRWGILVGTWCKLQACLSCHIQYPNSLYPPRSRISKFIKATIIIPSELNGVDIKTNQLSPAIGPVEDQGSPRIPSTSILGALLPTSAQESTWWDVLSRPRPETKFIPSSFLLRFGKYTCCTTPCTGHWKSRATVPSPTCHMSGCKWGAARINSGWSHQDIELPYISSTHPSASGPLSQSLPHPVNVARRPR